MYLIAIIAGAIAAAVVVVLASGNGGGVPPLGQGRADRTPWWRFPVIVLAVAVVGAGAWLGIEVAFGGDDHRCGGGASAVQSGESWICLQAPTAPGGPPPVDPPGGPPLVDPP